MAGLNHHNLTVGSFISSPNDHEMTPTNAKEINLMVNIVWIVLLCGIIIFFSVLQVARCVIPSRRSTDVSTQTYEASVGLKKSVVHQMSTRVLGSEVKICVTECTICLEEFIDGQNVRVLPTCGHEFHVGCIDKWFESHSSCPNCRNCLLQQPAAIPQTVVEIPNENIV